MKLVSYAQFIHVVIVFEIHMLSYMQAWTVTNTICWWIIIYSCGLNRMSVPKLIVFSCADYGFGNSNYIEF
jgi:hypothetical protein